VHRQRLWQSQGRQGARSCRLLQTAFSPLLWYNGVMTEYRLSVREWPESERPREKLAQYGASALSTAELLAIILRTGTAREDVVAMAQRLLVQKGGLLGLAHTSMTELAAEHGLGLAKGAQLKAALELGKRLLQDPRAARAQVRSPKDVADLVLSATRVPLRACRAIIHRADGGSAAPRLLRRARHRGTAAEAGQGRAERGTI
jgi:hypothetical protein